jgi:hypothetical protein
VLSCVFVCFLEDNRLIDPPKLAGPGEHELFFRSRPHDTDREYLLSIFDDLAKRAGTRDLFGRHNPIRQLPEWLSPDAAQDLLLPFFQQIDPSLGARFLGDLYQDLSEAARKKYALLQTPVFVEEFILDRTLEPAKSRCEVVQRALAGVHGVDLNPYAVAIARFRLLLAAFVAASFQLAESAGQVSNLPIRLGKFPTCRFGWASWKLAATVGQHPGLPPQPRLRRRAADANRQVFNLPMQIRHRGQPRGAARLAGRGMSGRAAGVPPAGNSRGRGGPHRAGRAAIRAVPHPRPAAHGPVPAFAACPRGGPARCSTGSWPRASSPRTKAPCDGDGRILRQGLSLRVG